MLRMFAIRDTKTEMFHPPFYAHNEGHALRIIQDMAMSEGSQLGRHPSDYSISEIGSFDDHTGEVVGSIPRGIMFVDELLKGDSND